MSDDTRELLYTLGGVVAAVATGMCALVGGTWVIFRLSKMILVYMLCSC